MSSAVNPNATEREPLPLYTASRYRAVRRKSSVVRIGDVLIGGQNRLVVQSMTTTPTQDVAATVAQSIRLAEAGCEVVRITAPNLEAARALKDIRKGFSEAGFGAIPLVADIHFLPRAAMEAVEHVEKVRVNPGNYADKKKFATRDYTDAEYDAEIQRLHDAFSPLVLRAKELGRALRIGTNHGSLSDRIMNRYGDTPLGMCESALEFIRICESHGFHDIVISMKASNPKVMIQAYRLIVAKMLQEDMHYPLHLGVTEAGDGDDARIKSAIGIGSLLFDGLGDTLRVSLTEDPVAEVPVARQLADKAEALWKADAHAMDSDAAELPPQDGVDPYSYKKRDVVELDLGHGCTVGPLEPPRVVFGLQRDSIVADTSRSLRIAHSRLRDARAEGLILPCENEEQLRALPEALTALRGDASFQVIDLGMVHGADQPELPPQLKTENLVLLASPEDQPALDALLRQLEGSSLRLALDLPVERLRAFLPRLKDADASRLIFTLSKPQAPLHPVGSYRRMAKLLREAGIRSPIWIRGTESLRIAGADAFGDRLLDASILAGSLICDGIGDLLSVESVADPAQSLALAYNILQGSRARTTKTEYVACPSCGRTLFDLQTTTQRIRAATGHLKGVTIAVMGCIVNGPGEMADADFGYVGGAPGKINLYVGKKPVAFNIPSEEAVDRLIDLIKEHGKWVEAPIEETVDSGAPGR